MWNDFFSLSLSPPSLTGQALKCLPSITGCWHTEGVYQRGKLKKTSRRPAKSVPNLSLLLRVGQDKKRTLMNVSQGQHFVANILREC